MSNLYWGTEKENVQDSIRHGTFTGLMNKGEKHPNHKLNQFQVLRMRLIWDIDKNITKTKIASMFNTTLQNVSLILKRTNWKHI